MLIFISPAKTLDTSHSVSVKNFTQPVLQNTTQELVDKLKKLSRPKLKKLMNISDNLTDEVLDYYASFEKTFTIKNSKPAVYMFRGDTYLGLDVDSLKAGDLKFAQKHLRILSGLYGVLSPLDLIQPYRLEMGTRLKTRKGDSLYAYWGNTVTELCNEQIVAENHKAVVCLASNEYIKVLKTKALLVPMITCHFKEIKDGKAKTIGFFVKRARGMMARYIIENRVKTPEKMKGFDSDGYQFDQHLSNEKDFVFTRRQS